VGRSRERIVYVVGAGLSAGLKFPTIGNLLPDIWRRLEHARIADDLAAVIRFHHPDFNPSRRDSYVDVETLLSEMKANEQLFKSSRPATGNFTPAQLKQRRQAFLLEVADWFHELQRDALSSPPSWLSRLVARMKSEEAQIISFNWDLVLDELLFGDTLGRRRYGLDSGKSKLRLIKPHGSLNWYERSSGRYLKPAKKFRLTGSSQDRVFAFRPFRAPRSSKRTYMPLIVQPVLSKEFRGPLFQHL
jgi:hypothetical protein